jgi:Bifunctional DNA primase/polymerase, N-terminal/AAA domain/Primase C terminal 2 (PriCT-2)
MTERDRPDDPRPTPGDSGGPNRNGSEAGDTGTRTNGGTPPRGQPVPNPRRKMALAYAKAAGWHVFPAPPGTKRSYKSMEFSNGRRWGATIVEDEINADWRRWPNANVGIAMGPDSNIWVMELDTPQGHNVDGFASLQALEAIHGPLPETAQVISPSGSIHYYWKWPKTGTIRNTASEIGPGIDVRGEGGMVIAPPSIKEGVGEYKWHHRAAVADAPDWLLALVIDTEHTAERTPSGDTQASVGKVAAALAVIPNPNEHDWERWNRIGMAVWAATSGHELGFEAFDTWSKKSQLYNPRNTREKWDALSTTPITSIGAGSIFYMADEADPTWRSRYEVASKSYPQIVQLAVKLWGEPTAASWREFTFANGTKNVSPMRGTWFDFDNNTGGDTRDLMKLVKAAPEDALAPTIIKEPEFVSLSFKFSELTATPWVARNFALRGAVTHIAGIGGAGKTGFTLQAAIAFVLGEDFAGFHPMRPLRIAFVSGEEPLSEIRRRIAAIVLDRVGQNKEAECNAFMTKLEGKLFTFEGKNVQIVAKQIDDEDGAFVIRTPFHKKLIANVKANKIDLVILDPIARLHSGLDENSAEMQELHNAADDLATECDCGAALVHHIKKSAKGSVDDQHASRGHSSMTDAARITVMMANMSKDEAKLLLPDKEQPHYFRYCKLGDPKQNYGINSPEKWFYKKSVGLPVVLEDGSPDARMVLERWIPDSTSVSILDAPWLQEFLDLIHAGIDGEYYRPASHGAREYRANALLEDRFNVHKQRSQLMLTQLVDAGILGITERRSLASRRSIAIYVVQSRVPREDEDIDF